MNFDRRIKSLENRMNHGKPTVAVLQCVTDEDWFDGCGYLKQSEAKEQAQQADRAVTFVHWIPEQKSA